MKTVLLAVLAFGVGLAGATGAVYARRDKTAPHAAADSAGTQVAGPDSPAHDSAAVKHPAPAARPESTRTAPVTEAPKDPVHDSAVAAPRAHDSVMAPPVARPLGPDYPRLAKILAAMAPASAIELIARLSDRDAEGILRSLGQRQVAALLSAMPKDRAAILGQRLLVQRDSGGVK